MQSGAFVIIVVTACGICGKPDNLAGKDVDLAATKPSYTQEAARRTQRGVS